MAGIEPKQVVARPSSSLVQQSVEVATTNSFPPVKLKEITVTYPGVYRIKFALRKAGGAGASHAQVYRNGAALGVIQQSTSGDFTTFSEDIGGWQTGDLLQLYGWDTGAGPLEVMSFSQWGEYSLRPPDITPGEVTLA